MVLPYYSDSSSRVTFSKRPPDRLTYWLFPVPSLLLSSTSFCLFTAAVFFADSVIGFFIVSFQKTIHAMRSGSWLFCSLLYHQHLEYCLIQNKCPHIRQFEDKEHSWWRWRGHLEKGFPEEEASGVDSEVSVTMPWPHRVWLAVRLCLGQLNLFALQTA